MEELHMAVSYGVVSRRFCTSLGTVKYRSARLRSMSANVKKRLRPNADDVRRAILDAALQLYLEKGFSSTSTDVVAARSSVSKRTIYLHFRDKDDLVREAIKGLITAAEEEGAATFAALAESDNFEHDIRAFARKHIEDVVQPDIMRMRRRIISEVDRFPDIALAWYEAAPGRAARKLAECFQRLTDRGLLRTPRPGIAAEQFNWLILSVPLNRAMFDPASVADTKLHLLHADAAVDVFLAAYGTECRQAARR